MESLGDSRPCRNTHPEVLHVRVLADDDLLVVPPQHAPVPYTRERADPVPPDHDRRGRRECTLRNLQPVPVERAEKTALALPLVALPVRAALLGEGGDALVEVVAAVGLPDQVAGVGYPGEGEAA